VSRCAFAARETQTSVSNTIKNLIRFCIFLTQNNLPFHAELTRKTRKPVSTIAADG
jgi:hypothetical protein